MFFEVARKPQRNFSHFYQLGPFHASTDAGWTFATLDRYDCVFKGYMDHADLESELLSIMQDQIPYRLGNFCVIVFDRHTQCLQIKSDKYRSFPLYFDADGITNLVSKTNTAWADSLLTVDSTWHIHEHKFDVIGPIETAAISVDMAVDMIDRILAEKTQQWLKHNTLPVKIFLSGGVDTLLVYSYVQRYTNDYEILRCQHFDFDRFWLLNSGTIQNNYWGYTQLHHYANACVLSSGAPGDEFMLRSPTTIDLLLKWHGQSVQDLLANGWKDCLHARYFQKPKHQEIFATQQPDAAWTLCDLHWNLCNIVVNDWQHWHLGHTLTWTPLRDLEIFKILLRVPVEELVPQIMNSAISRRLIEQNRSGLTALISQDKNSGNALSNLCDFLFQELR